MWASHTWGEGDVFEFKEIPMIYKNTAAGKAEIWHGYKAKTNLHRDCWGWG